MSALALVRAAHYVAIVQAFGALVFVSLIARAQARRVGPLAQWSLAVALVSWIAWLALQAPEMAGIPMRALDASTLWLVVHDTGFGRMWVARAILVAAAFALLALRRDWGATLVCAAAIATLAASGHAAADAGVDKSIHLAADALHLIAAGAWLGALLPLALALRSNEGDLHVLARRFSALGIACVGILVATGVVNSLYLVASWPALFGTRYGALLLAKLALFAAMIALAATNRSRSTPRLARRGVSASHASARIARNAGIEAALGAGLLAAVAVLGVSVPAAHDAVRWPFAFRLAFGDETGGVLPSVERAYPTTYLRPPERYTVTSIVRGAMLYAAQCSTCHGEEGRGDGPGAATLAPKPSDLTAAHVLRHRDGDLYWWITHGIAGTPMPAFGERLDESSRWALVQFVKTLAAATMFEHGAAPAGTIAAPEFTYQIGREPQRSAAAGSDSATLLVLYALPQSRARLLALAADAPDLVRAGIRVAAVSIAPADAVADVADLAPIAAAVSPGTATVYRLFAPDVAGANDGTHVEFLIDRNARLRARWNAGNAPAPGELSQQIARLGSAQGATVAPAAHEHAH